jgi:hypothetical protein
MKHFYFLLGLFFVSFSYGQATDLFFSKYGEGSSNNKFLEIYNGTGSDVDLSIYSVELYSNGNSVASNTLSLNGITLAAGDVYVIANSSADPTILNAADTTSTVTFFNGDDAIALLKNGTPIDVIGEIGVDPGSGWAVAGVANATRNHTLVRKSTVCSPTTDWAASAGTDANNSQWNVLANDAGWNDLGSFSGCSASPSLTITSPSDGEVFSPETTDVSIEFQVDNFNVAQTGGDGYIVYTVDNGTPQDKFDTNPINLTGLSQGQHTVNMELVDNSGNSLSPAVTDEVSFTIASYIQVPDLATLRAGNIGDYYEVTGEIYLTAGESFGSYFKGFAQDATAGIMFYDPNQVLDLTQYSQYDGVTHAKGKLTSYRGMLELIPTVDPGGPSSNGNTVTPQVVSIADFNANHEDYESELIKLVYVQIDPDSDNQFQINTNYDVFNATDTTTLRVMFSDLANENIPSGFVDITGIGGEYSGSPQIYPRNETDIEINTAVASNNIEGLKVYPNPVSNGTVYIRTASGNEKEVYITDLSDKILFKTRLNGQNKIRFNLPAGLYLLHVNENGRHATVKLLVK